jgi:hypothetical protein
LASRSREASLRDLGGVSLVELLAVWHKFGERLNHLLDL